jgi:hypothetical protein
MIRFRQIANGAAALVFVGLFGLGLAQFSEEQVPHESIVDPGPPPVVLLRSKSGHLYPGEALSPERLATLQQRLQHLRPAVPSPAERVNESLFKAGGTAFVGALLVWVVLVLLSPGSSPAERREAIAGEVLEEAFAKAGEKVALSEAEREGFGQRFRRQIAVLFRK